MLDLVISDLCFRDRENLPVVYLALDPSEVMALPLDSIDSCWR